MAQAQTVDDRVKDGTGSPCALCGVPIKEGFYNHLMVSPHYSVPLHADCIQRVKDGENIPTERLPRGY